MSRHRHRLWLLVGALVASGSVVAASSSAGAAHPSAGGAQNLVGTFRITAGSCDPSGNPSGSYFRMILPGGTLTGGKFFANPDSTCADKTFIPAAPGRDGGLITGRYQPEPKPAFDAHGDSLAAQIITPQAFTAINFSVSTNPTEPQTGQRVPKPAISVRNGRLQGSLRAVTASWNNEQFSQGSPKPDGSQPGLTRPVAGTYDPKTHQFVLEWSSQITGGPFNDFTGVWHLVGTFEPAHK